ncbi:hypothetical protein SDC9_127412 [bioreactor metagenome]|uniref:Uncharacterized protein n=1 Tax=bioreactor metagenome TaxID=1076179 RepID=A0A645CU06_9ZZZZ
MVFDFTFCISTFSLFVNLYFVDNLQYTLSYFVYPNKGVELFHNLIETLSDKLFSSHVALLSLFCTTVSFDCK